MEEKIRLSKLMVQRNICSRREADKYIEAGLVLVDNEPIYQLGTKVDPSSHVELKDQALEHQSQKITILLNKPLGYVSAQPEDDHKPAITLITKENRDQQYRSNLSLPRRLNKLAVAGRLDINSKGLLIFTQDGRIAKRLIGDNHQLEKEYLVRVLGKVTPEIIKRLTFGLKLDDRALKPIVVNQLDKDYLRFILKEGRKRQIRRMCDLVDLKVTAIKRVRIGKVLLSSLKEGQWRFLENRESF